MSDCCQQSTEEYEWLKTAWVEFSEEIDVLFNDNEDEETDN